VCDRPRTPRSRCGAKGVLRHTSLCVLASVWRTAARQKPLCEGQSKPDHPEHRDVVQPRSRCPTYKTVQPPSASARIGFFAVYHSPGIARLSWPTYQKTIVIPRNLGISPLAWYLPPPHLARLAVLTCPATSPTLHRHTTTSPWRRRQHHRHQSIVPASPTVTLHTHYSHTVHRINKPQPWHLPIS
jgi:hypothetical protein